MFLVRNVILTVLVPECLGSFRPQQLQQQGTDLTRRLWTTFEKPHVTFGTSQLPRFVARVSSGLLAVIPAARRTVRPIRPQAMLDAAGKRCSPAQQIWAIGWYRKVTCGFSKVVHNRRVRSVPCCWELLGPEGSEAFWHKYRENYIAHEDIALLHRAGFNAIRVPLHYSLFESDDAEGFKVAGSADRLEPRRTYLLMRTFTQRRADRRAPNIDDSAGLPLALQQSPGTRALGSQVWPGLRCIIAMNRPCSAMTC